MDMYRENIMDHFKNPRNEGSMENPTIRLKENNPLCGDEIDIYLKISKNFVSDVKFHVNGCAISKASASMVSECVKGMKKSDICSMKLEDVKKILGIPLTPSRVKCAMLGLSTIQKGLGCSQ